MVNTTNSVYQNHKTTLCTHSVHGFSENLPQTASRQMSKPAAYAWYISIPKQERHYKAPHDLQYFTDLQIPQTYYCALTRQDETRYGRLITKFNISM